MSVGFERHSVIIQVGLPGCGKTTLSRNLKYALETNFDTFVVCSADDFFICADGAYRFDGTRISVVHEQCREMYVDALNKKTTFVVVDNTNLKHQYRKFYIDEALKRGYKVYLMVHDMSEEKIPIYTERSVHGVPVETIQRMREGADLVLAPGVYIPGTVSFDPEVGYSNYIHYGDLIQ